MSVCPAAASAAPSTGPVIGLTPTSALVTATGVTDGAGVAYGQTTDYGTTAPAAGWPDEFLLTGLSPDTTYHYRVEMPTGSAGADRTLTTSPPGGPELVARPVAAGTTCTDGTWTSPASVTAVTIVPASSGRYACRVTVRGASASSYWTSRPARYDGPPSPIVPPAIRGDPSPAEGAVLTCDGGRWVGATALDEQWLRDGAPVDGETRADHRVGAADLGHAVACRVTATGPGGTAVASSPSVAVTMPVFTGPAVNAAAAASTPPLTIVLDDGVEQDPKDVQVSAASALKTLLAGRLPGRRVLLRGARLRFRAPAPLGMLRVKLYSGSAGPLLAVGARWYHSSRAGLIRIRLTRTGRRALRSGAIVRATLVATFVPDRGRSETESRRVMLGP